MSTQPAPVDSVSGCSYSLSRHLITSYQQLRLIKLLERKQTCDHVKSVQTTEHRAHFPFLFLGTSMMYSPSILDADTDLITNLQLTSLCDYFRFGDNLNYLYDLFCNEH